MNERIKELANQAWNDTDITQDIVYKMSFTERFAELIVQECAKIGDRHGGINVRSAIKKHFGVEE